VVSVFHQCVWSVVVNVLYIHCKTNFLTSKVIARILKHLYLNASCGKILKIVT